MNEFVNDFDIWQNALKKINMNEQVLPIYNGKMLYENGRTYLQMQKILDCEPMQKSHKFCLNIDPESPSEDEVKKVDELYRLGVDRGFIDDNIDDNGEFDGADDVDNDNECHGADCGSEVKSYDNTFEPPTTNMPTSPSYRAKYQSKIPSYTIMYSATKDGQTKTGETYSNAVNPSAAKADAMAKLSRVGYDNVSILAIECGDPDMAGFEDSYTQEDDILRNSTSNEPFVSKLDTDELNETELDVDDDDFMYGKYNKSMKTNNRFRNKEEVYEGVGGAIVGGLAGSALGAVGGGMIGDRTKFTGTTSTANGANPSKMNWNVDTDIENVPGNFMNGTYGGTKVTGIAYNGTNAAIGAGVGGAAGAYIGHKMTQDDDIAESQITDDTESIVDDILNEYDGEESKQEAPKAEPKQEASKSEPKQEAPKAEPKQEAPAEDSSSDEGFSFEIPQEDSSSSPDDDIASDSDSSQEQEQSTDTNTEQTDSSEEASSNTDEMNNMMDDAIAQQENSGQEQAEDGQADASETAPGNLAGSEGSGAEQNSEEASPSDGAESSDNTEGQGEQTTELDANKKAEYKDQYTKMFKNVMINCGFKGKTFNELTVPEMTQVYAGIMSMWKDKPDRKEFLTTDEIDQLHDITIEA